MDGNKGIVLGMIAAVVFAVLGIGQFVTEIPLLPIATGMVGIGVVVAMLMHPVLRWVAIILVVVVVGGVGFIMIEQTIEANAEIAAEKALVEKQVRLEELKLETNGIQSVSLINRYDGWQVPLVVNLILIAVALWICETTKNFKLETPAIALATLIGNLLAGGIEAVGYWFLSAVTIGLLNLVARGFNNHRYNVLDNTRISLAESILGFALLSIGFYLFFGASQVMAAILLPRTGPQLVGYATGVVALLPALMAPIGQRGLSEP
jgi:hypothetical protein